MKILLLGEFSAFHKNLKEGLVALGHDVTIASTGDGWKQIDKDIDLNIKNKPFYNKLTNRIYPWFELKKLYGYDIVQLINPFLFYRKFFPNKYYLEQIFKKNNKTFIVAAGSDAYFWKYGQEKLKYGPFDDFKKYDKKIDKFYMEKESIFKLNKNIVDMVDGIIPIMYEYEVSYKGHKKIMPTIPIPINIDKIEYNDNIVKDKLIIFHGLNRYGFKGTRHVEEAFNILKNKYPDKLELIIDGHMPLNKYLGLMKKTNIVIDQTNSYSLGVNGIYALAMGKVVLGGAEPESLISLGVNKTPVINIKPNANSIVEEVEKLLDKKENIIKIGKESRRFVEDVHGYLNIAEKFLKHWNYTNEE